MRRTLISRIGRPKLWALSFLIFTFVTMASADWIYTQSAMPVFLFGLVISWVPMNLIALTLERRWLKPHEQFWQFYIGDLIFLPGAMAGLAGLEQQLGNRGWDPEWWIWLCTAAAATAAVVTHYVLDAPKPSGYTESQWDSPAKLWHDLYVIPVFTYYLLLKLPLLWSTASFGSSTWGVAVAVMIMLVGWAGLGIVDQTMREVDLKKKAHIEFDWAHLRPAPASYNDNVL